MRKPDKSKKIISGVIILIVIIVLAIGIINYVSPTYSHINMLGVSLDVPEGSFDEPSEYNLYSIYKGKHNEWSVEAINSKNADLNNTKHKDLVNSFKKDKNMTILYNDNYEVDGIKLYKLGTSDYTVSFFKVGDVEFKIFGKEDTVLNIIQSIKDSNNGAKLSLS